MKKSISIRIQLTIALAAVVLPVVLWAIALSILLMHSAQERVRDSYQNELLLYQQSIDCVTTKLDLEMDSYLIQYQPQLYSSSKPDAMTQIEMVSGLKAVWQRTELVRGAWLAEKDGDSVTVTSDEDVIYFSAYRQLKEKLTEEAFLPDSSMIITDCLSDGSLYWFWIYPYGEYVVGFFSPVDAVLDELLVTDTGEGRTLFVQDKGGTILASAGDGSENRSLTVFSEQLTYMEESLCLGVPQNLVRLGIPAVLSVLLVFSVSLLVTIPVLWLLLRRILLNPLDKLRRGMEEIEREHMDYQLPETDLKSLEMRYVARQFNHMVRQIEDLKIKRYETELEKREIEAVNLRLQLNPHLLLNSLNLIFSLSQIEDHVTIARFTKYLADYFQYSLRHTDATVPLREEIEFVRNYLEIQKIRYPNTFEAEYRLEETVLERKIPSLLVENFVENCIKYAIKMGEHIRIRITASQRQDKLEIVVEDNGNGMSGDTLELLRRGEIVVNRTGKHIGIWNIRRRLQMAYGDEAELQIDSVLGKGTRIAVRIPVEVRDDVTDRG